MSGQGGSRSAAAEPRGVAAGRGWHWIAAGFNDYFRKDPVRWIATMVVITLILVAPAMMPGSAALAFVWNVLTSIVGSVFMGGLMLGCAAQRRGERFEIAHLFAAFSRHGRPLALVGLAYIAAFTVVVMLGVMVAGGITATADGAPLALVFAALIVTGLSVPIFMAYWFAPALVVLEERAPIDAMLRSFRGCLRNIPAFLVYGIVVAVLFIIAAIPVGLGLLFLAPTVIASIYAAWEDIFAAPAAPE